MKYFIISTFYFLILTTNFIQGQNIVKGEISFNLENIKIKEIKENNSSENVSIKKNIENKNNSDKKTKKDILNIVRKGVVLINVSAYESAEISHSTMWKGTGFIFDKELGIIVTNRHVAGQMSACEYSLEFHNGQKAEAKLHYMDPIYDFAFLKVDPSKIPENAQKIPVKNHGIDINDEIYSVGNSWGDKFSLINGTIFNIYENVGPFDEQSFQYSGITVGGASGSPVVNDNAEVIGIIYGGSFISGAALPISYISDAYEYIKEGKTPTRKYMGIEIKYKGVDSLMDYGLLPKEALDEYKKLFPNSNNRSIYVVSTMSGSSAGDVIKSGDIIWEVNGKKIGPNLYDLSKIVNYSSSVNLGVYRNGSLINVSLSPISISSDPFLKFVKFAEASWYDSSIYTKLRSDVSENGLYIGSAKSISSFREIASDSYWYSSSLVRVTHIEGEPVNSIDDLMKIIPSLISKKYFKVSYIDYFGQRKFGTEKITKLPIMKVVKNSKNFSAPKLYSFNSDSKEWIASDIK